MFGLVLALPTLGWGGEPSGGSLEGPEGRVLILINEARTKSGLGELRRDPDLDTLARRHSEAMASRGKLDHEGLEERSAKAMKLVAMAGLAENVSRHWQMPLEDTPAAAVESWTNSQAHRANLLGDFDLTGVGAAQAADGAVYFTQIFVALRPPASAPGSSPSR